MLFQNNIEPCCAYCCHGTDIGYGIVACIRRGIMADYGSCGVFRYEPTKRVPKVMPGLKSSGFTEEDFCL